MIYKKIELDGLNCSRVHQIAKLVRGVDAKLWGVDLDTVEWIGGLSDFCFMKQEASARFGALPAESVKDFDNILIEIRPPGNPFFEYICTKETDNDRLWDACVRNSVVWKFDREKLTWVANRVTFKLEKEFEKE